MGLFDPTDTAIVPFVTEIRFNPSTEAITAIVERGVVSPEGWMRIGSPQKVAAPGGPDSPAALSVNDACAALGLDPATANVRTLIVGLVGAAHAAQVAAAAAPADPAPLPPEGVIDPTAPAP